MSSALISSSSLSPSWVFLNVSSSRSWSSSPVSSSDLSSGLFCFSFCFFGFLFFFLSSSSSSSGAGESDRLRFFSFLSSSSSSSSSSAAGFAFLLVLLLALGTALPLAFALGFPAFFFGEAFALPVALALEIVLPSSQANFLLSISALSITPLHHIKPTSRKKSCAAPQCSSATFS